MGRAARTMAPSSLQRINGALHATAERFEQIPRNSRTNRNTDRRDRAEPVVAAAKSSRRSVTRYKNRSPVMVRLRLQMLTLVSERCNWNRRMSSAVAVSGDRFKNAANCFQLRMWALCDQHHPCQIALSLLADIDKVELWLQRKALSVLRSRP